VIDHILTTDYATYTVTAHPLMLDFSAKAENKENFENFLHQLTTSGQEIEFVTPSSLGDIAL
jgi:hypothetical protein